MNILLKGITKKGKQRVKEHGMHWREVKVEDRVNFSEEKGPWIFITPFGQADDSVASRWVHATNDTDFLVIRP